MKVEALNPFCAESFSPECLGVGVKLESIRGYENDSLRLSKDIFGMDTEQLHPVPSATSQSLRDYFQGSLMFQYSPDESTLICTIPTMAKITEKWRLNKL